MKRLLLGLGALGFCAALSAPVAGDDAKDCNEVKDPDKQVRACAALIRKGGTDKKLLSGYYINRAGGYVAKATYEDASNFDLAIADLTEAIRLDPKSARAFVTRANAHTGKGDYDRSIADTNEAIRLNGELVSAYTFRAVAYGNKGNFDGAMADANQAIKLGPKFPGLYVVRAFLHTMKGEYDRAIADLNEALRIDPKWTDAYSGRGWAYNEKREFDRAIRDLNEAIRLNPKHAGAHLHRGNAYYGKGEYDRAIADLTEAVRLDSTIARAYLIRGQAQEAKGQREPAIADYRKTLEVPAPNQRARKAQETAREQLARLMQSSPAPRPVAAPPAAAAVTAPPSVTPPAAAVPLAAAAVAALPGQGLAPGRRIALVIGNADYRSVGRLANPVNDSRAVAASLRRLGFAEVIERYDLGLAAMGETLKDFGDRTAHADWAVVFYAGHGMEMSGAAYLIPIDAKLERDSHVTDETVPLARVLEKVESARKLRLVILDACRNNPFVARMVRTGGASRSVGRGLAQIEPDGGVLVAYSARHGTIADDGAGANSPFTEALLAHLEEPGLEINFLFRKVRDRVLESTRRRQEPYLYGSLSSEALFFRAVDNR